MTVSAQIAREPMGRSLNAGAALTLAIKLLSALVSYGFIYILSQRMEVEEFGFIGALLTGSLLFAVIGAMGQQIAILRFIPPLRAARNVTGVQAVLRQSFRLGLIGSLGLWGFGAGISYLAAGMGYIADWRPVALGLVLIVLVCRIDMQASLARAWQAIGLALIPKEVLWRVAVGAAILVILLSTGQSKIGLYQVIFLLISVLLVLTLGQAMLIRRMLKTPRARLSDTQHLPPEWRASIVPFWLFSVSAVYFTNVDVALVGFFFGGPQAADYFLANRIAQALSFFLISYNIAIGPILSGHFYLGRHDAVGKAVAQTALRAFAPTLILGTVLFIWAAPILGLFGVEFSKASGILRILILAGVFNAGFGPGDLVLNMCGQEKPAMKISLLSILLGTLAMACLGLGFGPLGIAWGVCFAIVFRKGASWALARRRLGISSDVVTAVLHLWRARKAL